VGESSGTFFCVPVSAVRCCRFSAVIALFMVTLQPDYFIFLQNYAFFGFQAL